MATNGEPISTAPHAERPDIWGSLSEAEAFERMRVEGPNEIPASGRRTLAKAALEILREPMLLLLLAAGGVYMLLGDRREALVLLLSVFAVIAISLVQNRRSERALSALRELASPRALVFRKGVRRRIPGREVVRGDILLVSEGDRVPADAVLLEAANLAADESLLTGESVPAEKEAAASDEEGGDGPPDPRRIYSGSLVVSGCGVARVEATGPRTEIGRIGGSLATILEGRTRLQAETDRLVRCMALLGAALCLVVAVVYGIARTSWLEGLLSGLALAMALLPEEFPLVLTIFLALGAWRISRRRVLTRELPAIETLGAATVLCVDKTGTLTLNRMSVRLLCVDGELRDPNIGTDPLPEPFADLLETGAFASRSNPFDPMERAIRELAARRRPPPAAATSDEEALAEYPLSAALLATVFVRRTPDGGHLFAAKGAPEAIAELCRLDAKDAGKFLEQAREMAAKGLRVLGVAQTARPAGPLPAAPGAVRFEPAGLIGLADPIRPAVPAAVRECREAGIRIVMITGDHPVTAASVARQIGLESPRGVRVVTGAELRGLDDEALRRLVDSVDVFARVAPDQKLRLVRAFRSAGHVVAMTGDGVNDAPALKAADMGIAMGGRGTDVAREAADLVVLDDDFSSIVDAIRVGRRIFDNLRKALSYIVAVHVPIAGISLLPVLLGCPLVLLPLHIVFLELIIDPSCTLVFEAEEPERDVMRRPPRRPEEPMFTRRIAVRALLQGISAFAVVAGVLVFTTAAGRGAEVARTAAFTALVAANLGLILANRSWSGSLRVTLQSRNPAIVWVFSAALLLLGVSVLLPGPRSLLRFAPLSVAELAACLSAGFASALWLRAFPRGDPDRVAPAGQ